MNMNQGTAEQRAMYRLVAEERARMATEQAERDAQRQARQVEADQQAAAGELAAVDALAALYQVYERRQEAARQALQALAEFVDADREARAGEQRARAIVPQLERMPNRMAQVAAWRQLRRRAGLAGDHLALGLPSPSDDGEAVAVTALRAIAAGAVQPGAVIVGRERARVALVDEE